MIRLRAIIAAFLPAILLLFPGQVTAQKAAAYPNVETRVEPTSGTVGERFSLIISATVPDLQGLQTLPLFDTQTTWTAVGKPQVSDVSRGKNRTRTFTYTIIPFETGREAVPKVALTYAPAGGATSNTVLSSALWVDVNSVLSGNGSASALREVSPPAPLPVPAMVIWTGSVFIVLLLGLLGWWLWKRYSTRLKKMLGKGLTPPELALKEMDALESERLIEHKKIKEFYTRLTDSLRAYLQGAYGVQAMDLTSNELLRELDERAEHEPYNHAEQYRKAVAQLSGMLDEADLVKFARFVPDVSRCRKALNAGRDIVMLTRYRFEPVEEPLKPGNKRMPQPPLPPMNPPVISASDGGHGANSYSSSTSHTSEGLR